MIFFPDAPIFFGPNEVHVSELEKSFLISYLIRAIPKIDAPTICWNLGSEEIHTVYTVNIDETNAPLKKDSRVASDEMTAHFDRGNDEELLEDETMFQVHLQPITEDFYKTSREGFPETSTDDIQKKSGEAPVNETADQVTYPISFPQSWCCGITWLLEHIIKSRIPESISCTESKIKHPASFRYLRLQNWMSRTQICFIL